MALSEKEVRHIAHLCKLDLTENEVELFASQLSDVIGYADTLKKIDTTNVEPTHQVTDLGNVYREDVAHPYPEDKREKLLREVPKKKGRYVVVPHVIKRFR